MVRSNEKDREGGGRDVGREEGEEGGGMKEGGKKHSLNFDTVCMEEVECQVEGRLEMKMIDWTDTNGNCDTRRRDILFWSGPQTENYLNPPGCTFLMMDVISKMVSSEQV